MWIYITLSFTDFEKMSSDYHRGFTMHIESGTKCSIELD